MTQNRSIVLFLLVLFFGNALSAQETTATYRLTFDAAWSRTTHPYQFPFDARWSPVVGLTHDENTSLFETGTVATQGIVNMSQTGSRDPLNDEIQAMIDAGGGEFLINAQTRVNPSPDTITTVFDISSSHPYLSLASMIAPSPDWFVAFQGVKLYENDEWVESKIIQFKSYDSGSDSGITFASPNLDTQPREGIEMITDGPLFANGQSASLGVWRLERIDTDSQCDVDGGSLVGGPFEFCVDGTPDNIPNNALSVNGASGANNQWVITDDRGYILGLPPSFTAPDFDAAGVGLCFVYHLSYEDGLNGLSVGNNIEDLDGCFSLSNSSYVDRQSDEETCNPDETARYRVIFDATWSAVTHPVDFPTNPNNQARWSPVAGMTHNAETSLFVNGTVASQGIVNMSQTGSRDPLNDEIQSFIDSRGAEFLINATTRVNPSPDTVSFEFDITSSHPRVSMVSMIAPSPDWFVALRDLQLFNNGEWAESKVINFHSYDSGSDSGTSFASPNQDTQPREGIYPITDGPLVVDGNIASLGLWRIERIDNGSICDVNGGVLTGGPFNFCVDGTADNIPEGALTVSDASGANSQWVVTDDRGYILGLPPSFTAPDFDAAGVGLCFVYHLSYEDGLAGLEVGNNIDDLNGCFNLSNSTYVRRQDCSVAAPVGAVYAMTNGKGQVDGNVQGPNSIIAYAQAADGTLTFIGEYTTGGNGGDFDGGEGLDPLISAYAITKTVDNRFVLAVNAGSNTVTSLKVNADYSLSVIDTESTADIGPNSVAHKPSDMPGVNGLVYVSNITRAEFLDQGEPGHQGSVIGYRLMDDGSLEPVDNSIRDLANRPSAVQFSPDGNFLAVTSINSGASGLESGDQNELVIYRVNADGTLSADPTAGATSTLRNNVEGRNLPSAIGFQIVGDNYVVVTEAREFQPNGAPPAFPALQDGSVSTWQIQADGSLLAIDLDVASGVNNTGRTACWLDFSDENTFFVSNAIEAGLASYSFNDGDIELLDQIAAQGIGATGNTTDPGAAFSTTQGWIDLWISDDGKYLYQCYGLTGTVGVFEINGAELTLIQEVTGDLPVNNVQGIVSVGEQIPPAGPAVGAVYAMTNGRGQIPGNVQGPNSIIAYGQAEDGTLTFMGEFLTGGNGGDYDGGEGLDPLISAYAITKTIDNRFVLAVNAGSNTVTSLKVNDDFSLTVIDIESTEDIGPNSVAHKPSSMPGVNGLVYVSNITRAEFLDQGEPGHQGSVIGYRLMDDGSLEPVDNSIRDLANRPSAVQFSPDGNFLAVTSINSGASGLESGDQNELVIYRVNADGTLSADPTAGATSTLRDNVEGRNLPSAIGFQIVDDNYVVVTEAREFQPDGAPPAFPALQDGSVSTWQIQADGSLLPIDLDVASGVNNTGRTACWLDFSDENTFFVSNAIEAGLASYSFNDGDIELLDQVAAQGIGATGNTTDPGAAFSTTQGWIDLWISDDGRYLYQCYGLTGTVGVFEINGAELTLIQEVSGDLPINNVQGIVSVGQQTAPPPAAPPVGAVYAMTNGEGQIPGIVQGPNSIVAYGQAEDGTLTLIGEYLTGGNGGDFDGGEGLDPLISAYAITKTIDNRFVLAVNAGSNTVTSLKVNDDFSLTVVDTESTEDIGPNSVTHHLSSMPGVNGLVYVSNITRAEFLDQGEPGHQGSVIGYKLMDDGSLEPIENSIRDLANRPSAVQFSPNGDFLVAASINAGAAALESGSQDEIVVYRVNADGTLSANQIAAATSTLRDNTEGRNLPSAIGFQIVDDNYVVVTEAREFQPDGAPPAFPALQDGSVSTWQIQADGSLLPIDLDVASGVNNTGRTACWLDFSDENTFFVSNAIEAGLASYSFNDGDIELLDQVAAQGIGATGNTTDPGAAFGTTQGWIDLWISDDGRYLYQCYGLTGTVGVFEINGAELTLIQEVSGDLPMNNVQGIVSVGQITDAAFVDVSLDIEVDNLLYDIYEEVAYTITATNEGTLPATNVVVSAGLPDGMVFTSANESAGEYNLFFEEWTIDELGAGETATLELTLFTLVEGVNIDNFVEVIAMDEDDVDSNPGNGTGTPLEDDEAVITITPADDGGFGGEDGEANLSLDIVADTDVFDQFENVTFTITLTNDGPNTATSIEVAAGLPDGLVYTSHNTTLGDYNLFFEAWTIESLVSGESAVLELELFTLVGDGTVTAYAEVFEAGQFDPNSTPGNGDGVNANEDDEAAVTIAAVQSLSGASFRNESASQSAKVFMDKLYPTPTVNELNLEVVNTEELTDAIIAVFDLKGRSLIRQEVILSEGFNEFRLNVTDLAEGNYFINISNENGTLTTKRFVKVNR